MELVVQNIQAEQRLELTIALERQTLLHHRTLIDCRLLAEATDWRMKLI
jgi:hypothetical protein